MINATERKRSGSHDSITMKIHNETQVVVRPDKIHIGLIIGHDITIVTRH